MDNRVGFMHLPKTGGISLCAVIVAHLPWMRVCPPPRFGVWDHTVGATQSYDLYSGHFAYDFFQQIGDDTLKLTMLRHPVARMVSLYDYWRGYPPELIREITSEIPDNGPRFAASVSFEDFVSNPTPFVRAHTENGLCRQLLGSTYRELASNETEMLREADRRLATFDWIGITEDFDRSVVSLGHLLGFELTNEVPVLNSSYHGDDRRAIVPTYPTKRAIALINQTNQADFALYDSVVAANRHKVQSPVHSDSEI